MPRNPFPAREPRPRRPENEPEALPPPPDDDLPLPAAEEEDLGAPEIAEAVGPTLEEAIENALETLGAREDEVEIEILQAGRRPWLGLGRATPFRVRVLWREDMDEEVIEEEISEEESLLAAAASTAPPAVPEPPSQPPDFLPPGASPPDSLLALARRARAFTEDLLHRMGIAATVRAEAGDGEIHVDIETAEDDSLLIGRRGDTRAALQHLVQRFVAPRQQRTLPILLDVNGYWRRRLDRLSDDALALAALALERGQQVSTEALSAQERRVVHRALANDPRVRTESVGEGSVRCVAIFPVGSERE